MRLGVLLPHTGARATRERIVDYSVKLEQAGFDSVWVRDHLVWHPHGIEGTDVTFVEPLLTLATVGALTKRIVLGTAVLIPLRWPLKLAQDLASLSYLVGPRVIAGIGMGFNPAEFSASGLEYERREQTTREMVEICRKVWSGKEVSYQGEVFQFENVAIRPTPTDVIPFWYGGATRASVRRAVDYCDGWLPGRIPMATLDDRLQRLRDLGQQAGKRMQAGAIPLVKIARTREEARRDIDFEALGASSEGAKHWIKPPSGRFEAIEDFEGLLIAGSPEDCVEEIRKFEARGLDELVLDLRLQWHEYERAMDLIAERVLPALGRGGS